MKKINLVFNFLLLICFNAFAQGGWQRIYPMISGGPNGDGIDAVRQTPDGGYIMAGVTENVSAACKNRVVKVNDLGMVQWSNTYFNPVNNVSWATNVELAPAGGYYVEGRRTNPVSFGDEVYIQRLDDNGNELWTNFYPQATVATKGSVTADGGYVAVGYDYDNVSFIDSVALIKIDAGGNLNWLTKYPATDLGIVHSVIQTLNGEYVVEGFSNNQLFLARFDSSGNFLWRNLYGTQSAHPEYIGKVVENADSTLCLAGNVALTFGVYNIYLLKTNAAGGIIWEQTIMPINTMASDLDKTADGGYIICGIKNHSTVPKVILVKTDGSGNTQWVKEYNGNGSGSYKAYGVRQTADGGYIVGGAKVSGFYTRQNMYLIKTDELGEIYSNTLQGYVFDDSNGNCQPDTGEYKMANRVIEVSGSQTYWASTNNDGYYWLRVDTGNYQMILHSSANTAFWQNATCTNDTIALSIPNQYSQIDTSFAQTAIAYCPLLNVSLSTPFLRRCFNSNYYVHYSNDGTTDANNAYIDVNFDNFLSVDTSALTIPWSLIGPNTYRFSLGTVGIGASGTIPVSVYVSCNAVLGQTHCSQANIAPTSNCLLPAWSGAVIELNAQCVNDSILFTLHNAGAAASSVLNYTLIQDTVIINSGTFNLGAGQSQDVIVPTPAGANYLMIAEQEFGYPAVLGDSLLSVGVEGCGGNGTTGVITQYSNYDGSPFVDIDCRMNIGAYDPNEKYAFPSGYSANHYIYPETVLEYLIRFQNTGTDTAFSVIIRDTISDFLDIASINPGSSSHPFTYMIHGDNAQVVDFIFNNIQLPDSNTNEPASHGFVQFEIHQKNNNPIGTLIENNAGIYFDFNEPVITNTTFHEIGQNFIEMNLVGLPSGNNSTTGCKVYPNPSRNFTIFELNQDVSYPCQLEITGSLGNTILKQSINQPKFRLDRGNIPSGIYFYRISGADGILAQGKLVFH